VVVLLYHASSFSYSGTYIPTAYYTSINYSKH